MTTFYWIFGPEVIISGSRYCPDPGQREKIDLRFYFTLLYDASKGFMKALETFRKPFGAPQRSLKIKI